MLVARLDDTTIRLDPGGAPLHDSLDGLFGHVPSATSQPANLIPRTAGDGTYELVPEPSPDPETAAGRVLGATKSAPTPAVEYTAESALDDYDAATLAVTFQVPPSGNVMVDLDATVRSSINGSVHHWIMRDSGVIVPGTRTPYEVSQLNVRRHATMIVTGLTPGQNLTWTWGVERTSGGGSSIMVVSGDETTLGTTAGGPAIMVVRDAPF